MEPITTELRKLMAHTVDGFDLRRPLVECDRAEFERLCDQIDAVHESLERESDRLKCELDRVLGELDDMHKSGDSMQNAEHESKVGCTAEEWDYWESTHIELPKDRDGVPIRIGDAMEGEKVGGGFCEPFEVVGYIMSNGELEPMDEHKCPRKRKYLRHYHAPTVEDVLRKFAEGLGVPVADSYIAASAAKLQLKEDE